MFEAPPAPHPFIDRGRGGRGGNSSRSQREREGKVGDTKQGFLVSGCGTGRGSLSPSTMPSFLGGKWMECWEGGGGRPRIFSFSSTLFT
jgi:hypothetical protein